MPGCAFIGDEVTAAGFRLAGFSVYTPAPEAITTLFDQLSEEMELLIITAEMAHSIPEKLLRRTFDRGNPLLLVIPDIRNRAQPIDLAAELRQQLGMSE